MIVLVSGILESLLDRLFRLAEHATIFATQRPPAISYILSLTCRYVHASNASLLRRNVKIPINLTLIAIALLQPLVRLLEMSVVKKSPVSTERTGMRTLQHQVLSAVNALHSALRRLAPGQEHNTSCTLCSHGVDDLLCELLPSFACVRVCGVRLDRQACVEE